ncbi:hypothetical protein ANN_04334 [Periplaneta americana]|uniref:Uncharacterized protein n=1 Tax=Periplaneta americana TaxID=6978 RepID=A0ABQ8T9X7_PERAM|nr:hypothetical protein ANN_04334 [Periplaneta americana]
MKGPNRPAGCWPHVHMQKQRWTIIQSEWRYRVVSTMIPPDVIAGFRNRISIIAMLGGHRSHTLAEISFQLLHALHPDDYRKRYYFVEDTVHEIDNDEQLLDRIVFSDEATCHVSEHVHLHNVRIWAYKNPHTIVQRALAREKKQIVTPRTKNGQRNTTKKSSLIRASRNKTHRQIKIEVVEQILQQPPRRSNVSAEEED